MTELMGEDYKKTREYYLTKIDSTDLKQRLQEKSPAKIANEDFIDGLKAAFSGYKAEIQAFHEEVKELQQDEKEAYDFTKYFDKPEALEGFNHDVLAKDIMDDFEFKKLRDSEEVYVYKEGRYQENGRQVIEEEIEKRLASEATTRRVEETRDKIERNSYIKRKDFQPPQRKICLKNGVYDLETETLENHSPQHFFTHQIPTRYDPSKDCEAIHSFLHDIVRTEKEVKTLREIAGMLLLPDYPIPKAFMLLGKGNNGKSRYLDLLRNLIGEDNITEKGLQDLGGRFGTHELQGKLACIDDDLSSRKIDEESAGTLKKLTGGSRIGAEVKYGGHYNFYNYATPIFAANELPRTVDDTDGFYRRWILVEFPYKFKEKPEQGNELEKQGRPKKELMDEIACKDQLEGFLWWAIEGLKDVLENSEFTHAPTTQEAREKWREYSVPLTKFISTYVEQGTTRSQAEREASEEEDVRDYGYDYVRKDFLEQVIGDYCEARSHSRPSKKAISRELEKQFYVGTKSRTRKEPEAKRVPVYSGIKVSYPDVGGCPGVQTYSETIACACGHACVNNSKQSVDTGTGGDSLSTLVKEKAEDEIEVQDIVEDLEHSEERVEQVVDSLLDDGELFEPSPGTVKVMN